MGWMKTTACVFGAVLLMVGQLACTVPVAPPPAAQMPATSPPSGAAVGVRGVVATSTLLAATAWTAFAIEGVPEVLNPKPKLRWDLSGRITGTGGCNAFGGSSAFGPDSLRLGPLAATGKACLTAPGGQEDQFFKALELTRKARLEGEQLVLQDGSGKTLARFLPAN